MVNGSIAQPGGAFASHAKGHEFDPRCPHNVKQLLIFLHGIPEAVFLKFYIEYCFNKRLIIHK